MIWASTKEGTLGHHDAHLEQPAIDGLQPLVGQMMLFEQVG